MELADQYKVMDAVSDVPRRNMLARHLREVVDILEQKVSFSFILNVFCHPELNSCALGGPNSITL